MTEPEASADQLIEAALAEADYEAAAHYMQRALEMVGQDEDYNRFVQCKYLWHIKNLFDMDVWPERDTYATFAQWIRGYYQRTPQGKKESTCYNMVRLWDFYAEQQGRDIDWMVQCGKSKLERMLSAAAQNLDDYGNLDGDMAAVLEDPEIGFADVMDNYKSRKGEWEEQEDEELDGHSRAFRLLTRPGDGRPNGTLECWRDGLANDIGRLDVDVPSLMDDIMAFCEKAGVRVI